VEVSVWFGAAPSVGAVCESFGDPSSPAPPSGDDPAGCRLWEVPQAATIAKTPKAAGIVDLTRVSVREARRV
jgi:hypothetical protein